MLKSPVALSLGNVLPLPAARKNAASAQARPQAKPKQTGDVVRFGNANAKESILNDPALLNFNMPVNPQMAAQFNQMLMKVAEFKKQSGGTIKMLINSPGGDVYAGLQTMEFMQHVGVPIDTIVLGGQAASMGSYFFMAGTGRRIMGQNSSILIHQPRIMLPAAQPMTMSEMKNMAYEQEGLHHRLQRLISEKSGMSMEEVKLLTDSNLDLRLHPLEALKLGIATHVLLDNGQALTRDTVKGLSNDEIKQRDWNGDYSGLQAEPFDLQNKAPRPQAVRPGMPSGRPPQGRTPVEMPVNPLEDFLKDIPDADPSTGNNSTSRLSGKAGTDSTAWRPTIIMMA